MIESLFGAAAPPRLPAGAPQGGDAPAPRQDVEVDEQALAAWRAHLGGPAPAPTLADDPDWTGRNIALLDPTGLAAAAVMDVLARAGGHPVQQLNLRAPGSPRTLAVVSRCTLRRPGQAPLQVLSTELREPAGPARAFAEALAERADLAVVFVGHLPAAALAALREQLVAVTQRPGWRCPALLFVLPIQRRTAQDDLLRAAWPAGLAVQVVVDQHGQPLALWNRIAELWQALQPATVPGAGDAPVPRLATPTALATGTAIADGRAAANQASLGARRSPASRVATSADAAPGPAPRPGDDATELAERCTPLLARLVRHDGMQACALVDLASARTLAAARADADLAHPRLDDLARALCQARDAHRALTGEPPLPDEVLITSGERQVLLRRLPGPRRWGFLALADRGRVNLALLRFSLVDLEQQLQVP